MKAITTDFLANKKQYSCLYLGFVGFKNGFNHRQLTENLKPFLELTKAMKTLPISCGSLIKTVALKFLMKTEKRKTSIERQGCKWGWRRVVFFEQFVCFLAGFAQKKLPWSQPLRGCFT